jgi:hypothetical protein
MAGEGRFGPRHRTSFLHVQLAYCIGLVPFSNNQW